MCDGCPAPCCKLSVELTCYDIARIFLGEKFSTTDFVYYAEAGEGSYGFKAFNKKLQLMLRLKDGSCIFFKGSDSLHCSIEKSKPSICLSYPFIVAGNALKLQDKILCPPENIRRADSGKMNLELLKDNIWEWESYRKIIDDWNLIAKGDETVGDFWVFALQETDLRMEMEDSWYQKLSLAFGETADYRL